MLVLSLVGRKKKDSVNQGREVILHSSICRSQNLPNQFSEQTHPNRRGAVGNVLVVDSMQVPCSPHGLIGSHSDEDGVEVVRIGSGVVVVVVVVVVNVKNVGGVGNSVIPWRKGALVGKVMNDGCDGIIGQGTGVGFIGGRTANSNIKEKVFN